MSVFVWVMIGVALWHFAVLVPDRFYGGIIGALIAAVGGALISGYLLPLPGIPAPNPPGITEALWPIPGSIIALVATYGTVLAGTAPGEHLRDDEGDLGSRHSGAARWQMPLARRWVSSRGLPHGEGSPAATRPRVEPARIGALIGFP